MTVMWQDDLVKHVANQLTDETMTATNDKLCFQCRKYKSRSRNSCKNVTKMALVDQRRGVVCRGEKRTMNEWENS